MADATNAITQLGSSLLALLETASLVSVFVVRDDKGTATEFVVSGVRSTGKSFFATRDVLSDALVAARVVVTRHCPQCRRDLPVELFARNREGKYSWCKFCFRKYKGQLKRAARESSPHLPTPDHPL